MESIVNRRILSLLAGLFLGPWHPASATVLYVDINSPSPVPPYTNLATAATDIQTAVNAAAGGDFIWVNDGFYENGSGTSSAPGLGSPTVTNRVAINKSITVQSINGPAATYISGSGIYRCVYLNNNAALNGFTLLEGKAGWPKTLFGRPDGNVAINGGGVSGYLGIGGTVSNCVITGNSATAYGGGAYCVALVGCSVTGNSAVSGGGAASCTLLDCSVTGNSAPYNTANNMGVPLLFAGGGIYGGSAVNCVIANNNALVGGGGWGVVSLVNCSVAGNSASVCGGLSGNTLSSGISCSATNSIIYFKSADTNANSAGYTMSYCCTLPLPAGGLNNITDEPDFVALGSDYHQAGDSPTINGGNNAPVSNPTDLDGNPRIAGGTVDMGAYEYQTPASVIAYAWLEQYGFPLDGSADYLDPDGDGMNNRQEWLAGTNPTNAASVLTLALPQTNTAPHGMKLTWQSLPTRTYCLQRSTNLAASPAFITIQSNLTGQAGTTSFTDTTATNGGAYFYRIGAQ